MMAEFVVNNGKNKAHKERDPPVKVHSKKKVKSHQIFLSLPPTPLLGSEIEGEIEWGRE